jgi:beta-galactosidase
LASGLILLATATGYSQEVRERRLFDNGWQFHLGEVPEGQSPALADKDWRKVDLPHDWSIEGPYSTKNASGTGFLPERWKQWGRKAAWLPPVFS